MASDNKQNNDINVKDYDEKSIRAKEYRKKYYLENKDKIKEKNKTRKDDHLKILIEYKQICDKLPEEIKKIDSEYKECKAITRLSKIKTLHRRIKTYVGDCNKYNYHSGIYEEWLLRVNFIYTRSKLTESILTQLAK